MTAISRAVFAMLMGAAFASPCWGQRLIPPPRFIPPPRLPVTPFRPPTYVPRIPTTPPPRIPSSPIGPPASEPARQPATESVAPTRSAAVASDDQGDSDALIGVAVFFGGVGAVVGLAIGWSVWRNRTVDHLRIIRTPPGEAPEEIRRAWVGVELPLRRWETEPDRHLTVGALSQKAPEMAAGYAVDGRAAVKALASHSPEAAAWWRENAPQVLARGYRLWFPSDVCERVRGRCGTTQAKPRESVAATDTAQWLTSDLGLGADGREGVWRRQVPPWEK
jgi:hypothetical protein